MNQTPGIMRELAHLLIPPAVQKEINLSTDRQQSIDNLLSQPCAEKSSAILEYDQQEYKKKYGNAFLAEFIHGSMTNGPVDVKKVSEMVKLLNDKVTHITKAVIFKNDENITRLEGGSCSSIALRICRAALLFLQKSENDSMGLIESVKSIVKSISSLNSSGRKEIRSVQAAFNTIHVETAVKVNDISQEKIRALAAFYDMKVCQSTEELVIETTESFEQQFNQTLKSLNAGVYLLRILQKENNHKLETQGHSTVFIIDNQGTKLYFDTQLGLYDVNHAPDLIFRSICSAKKRFEVTACKFHQLTI